MQKVLFVVIGACRARLQGALTVTQQQQHNAEPENRPALRGRELFLLVLPLSSFHSSGFLPMHSYPTPGLLGRLAGRFVTHTRYTPTRSVCIQTKTGQACANVPEKRIHFRPRSRSRSIKCVEIRHRQSTDSKP